MTRPRQRGNRWRVVEDGHIWPICLEHLPNPDQKAPIWVWGDVKLARKVARKLNEDDEKLLKVNRLTGQKLAELMVKNGLVDSAAIDDPEGYDNFQTLEGINAIARELRLLNEKARKE